MRGDLVLSPQPAGEVTALVVKDPACGRFFRFREVEAFILTRLDGATAPERLQAEVEGRFHAPLAATTLDAFLSKLERLRLLDGGEAAATPGAEPRRRTRGSPLYLRLAAFDPDRLFDRLLAPCRPFFTAGFLVFSAGLILVAAGLTAANWYDIGHEARTLFNVHSLVTAYATLLVVVTLHEFAHGLTCKHFGGSVRELGMFLIFFQPAFYCNVSDAWLFPRRSHRLWVTFAGAYFELFVWAIATVVWRLTDPAVYLNQLALIVMITSGIKTLFNLNPLIKLDGYYLLSDYLNVPNLRGRAFGWVRDRLAALWGSPGRGPSDAGPRETRIYALYGTLAWIYSTWLLSVVLLYIGRGLTGRFQAWGFAMFMGLVGLVFQSPLRKGVQRLTGPPGRGGPMSTRGRWLIRLGVAAGVVATLVLVRMDLRIGGPFTVLPAQNADVRADVDGVIESVSVDEGTPVRKGDVLAVLSGRDYEAELRMIEAELAGKRAQLDLLKAGARPEEVAKARTALTKAEERIAYANESLDRARKLFAENLISKREYDDAREQATLRGRERDEASDELALVQAGSRKEDVEATGAELSRLAVRQHYLEDQLQRLRVTSPIDGIVTTSKLQDKVGEAVKQGDLIAKVFAMSTVNVEIAVPENEIADVSLGRDVVLKAQAYPQRSFHGVVTAIAPIATEPGDPHQGRSVRVTTRLPNPALLLKPEMTGHAKITCGRRRLIELVGRRLVRFFKVEFWSWW
jgi:putative peptide zinc metalloprotease protein